jgi:hypothetical protein
MPWYQSSSADLLQNSFVSNEREIENLEGWGIHLTERKDEIQERFNATTKKGLDTSLVLVLCTTGTTSSRKHMGCWWQEGKCAGKL